MFEGGREVTAAWCAPTRIGSIGGVARVPSWIAPKEALRPESEAPPSSSKPAHVSARPSTAEELIARASVPAPVEIFDQSSASEHEIAHLEQEIEQLRNALAASLAEGARVREEVLNQSEGDLVSLAIAIAERVIGRELKADPDLVAGWAREAKNLVAENDEVTVAIAPDVAELVPKPTWKRALGLDPIVDPALDQGSCEIRVKQSRVDAGMTARLGRVLDTFDKKNR